MDFSDSGNGGGPAPPDEFSDEGLDQMIEVLSSAGGAWLIAQLHDEPKRFQTLRQDFPKSPSTIDERLEEGRQAGLVDEQPKYVQKKKYHRLTEKGEVIGDEIERTDLLRIQEEIWRLEQELDEELDAFRESLVEKQDELNEAFIDRVRVSQSKGNDEYDQ
ncbi:hypothetical protein ABNG02_14515 [Halorubrum ejinorense]|uniref:HTH hxlR-type domain-containing protein n=1 Tax=Halorubrum ejinorense TaxID=425309 RepID=A0AAV3SRA3_9EURY